MFFTIHTHTLSFLGENNISDEYTKTVSVFHKHHTAKNGPLISANNSYSFSYKMGKGAKGKEGKPCIRPKKHAQAGPTVKRTAAKLVINPDKPKVSR